MANPVLLQTIYQELFRQIPSNTAMGLPQNGTSISCITHGVHEYSCRALFHRKKHLKTILNALEKDGLDEVGRDLDDWKFSGMQPWREMAGKQNLAHPKPLIVDSIRQGRIHTVASGLLPMNYYDVLIHLQYLQVQRAVPKCQNIRLMYILQAGDQIHLVLKGKNEAQEHSGGRFRVRFRSSWAQFV